MSAQDDLFATNRQKIVKIYGQEGTPEYKEYLEKIHNQQAYEQELVSQRQFCPAGIDIAEVSRHLPNLQSSELHNAYKHFYNPEITKAIACLANAVILDYGSFAQNERIREYFGQLRQIGDISSSGYAIQGTFSSRSAETKADETALFVIKVPQSSDNYADLIHECAVAFAGVNRLRDLGIPNFAYVYGAFECSPPFINTTGEGGKQVVAFCNSQIQKTIYVIYENIAPSESFQNLIERTDVETFMTYYLQTMIAVKCAYEICDFTHYDLHTENVLIRHVSDTPFQIPYTVKGKTVYVYSPGGIASIIDYGRSHIRTLDPQESEVRHLGDPRDHLLDGILPDQSNPLYDAFRLFESYLITLDARSIQTPSLRKTFTTLLKLLTYFEGIIATKISDPEATFVQILRNHYVFLVDRSRSEELCLPDRHSLNEWIQKCREMCRELGIRDPISNEPIPNLPIFGREARDTDFGVSQEILRRIVSIPPHPATFLEFYDLYQKYLDDVASNQYHRTSEEIETFKRDLLTNFQAVFPSALNLETARVAALLTEFDQDYAYLSSNSYSLPKDYNALFDDFTLGDVRTFTTNIASFFDVYQRLQLSVKVAKEIRMLFPNRQLDELIVSIEKRIGDWGFLEYIEELEKSIREDIDFLDCANSQECRDAYQRALDDPDSRQFQYYWTTFVSLAALLI